MLFCCYVVPLLFSCSTIPLHSDCSASVPLFRQSSAGVPCSGVPGSLIWPRQSPAFKENSMSNSSSAHEAVALILQTYKNITCHDTRRNRMMKKE